MPLCVSCCRSKRTRNPEAQSATVHLLVTHGTRWQASLCPPTAPESVEDPCGRSRREQTKWEAGVQDSGFRHIPPCWQMAYSWPGSKDPGHLVNFPRLGAMSISQTSRGHRPHSWIILLEAASVPVFWMYARKGIFPQPTRLLSTLSHNYCGLYQHRKCVL